MVKLKYLKIHKYRDLQPTTLTFSDGFNIILGQNGTGKTTLLNLLSMIFFSNFSQLKNEEFDFEYKLTIATKDITVDIVVNIKGNKQKSKSSKENESKNRIEERMREMGIILPVVTEEISDNLDFFYSLTFGLPGNMFSISMSTPPELILKEDNKIILKTFSIASPFSPKSLFLDLMFDLLKNISEKQNTAAAEESVIPMTLVIIMQYISNSSQVLFSRFDESLLFWGIFNFANEKQDILSISYDTNTKTGKLKDHANPPMPKEILDALGDGLSQKTNENDTKDLSFIFSDYSSLNKIADIMGFKEIALKLEFTGREKSLDESKNIIQFGNLMFLFTKHNENIINHAQLSYGQKRIFSFLYYLALNDHVVIADELVNGLHYQWIEDCLKEIGDRQAFLTSQNPLLLDHLEFHDAEHVRNSFIQCRVEVQDGKERMSWENISEEDSERFYRAYEAGIQHVSEILRTKGLW